MIWSLFIRRKREPWPSPRLSVGTYRRWPGVSKNGGSFVPALDWLSRAGQRCGVPQKISLRRLLLCPLLWSMAHTGCCISRVCQIQRACEKNGEVFNWISKCPALVFEISLVPEQPPTDGNEDSLKLNSMPRWGISQIWVKFSKRQWSHGTMVQPGWDLCPVHLELYNAGFSAA